jgi:flagellar biosynthetic protein FlhB
MADESYQERTEPASARKRAKAREQGQVTHSAELDSAIVLLASTLLFLVIGGTLLRQMLDVMRDGLSNAGMTILTRESMRPLMLHISRLMSTMLIPVLATILVVGLAANILQVGFLFTGQPLLPKWEKLNPAGGFKRLFSLSSLVNLAKGILKLFFVGLVAYLTLREQWAQVYLLMDMRAVEVMWFLGKASLLILFRTTLVLLVIAVLDYGYQRWQYEKNLRMTKEEIREESRTTEGDPGIRARIRSLQREMIRKRMMGNVPEADVVITNPVHLAVALQYDAETMRAPVVVAMGARLIADRIREIAREHGVPIVENPPLAQALYKSATVGMEIPVEVYRAVAEVLGYIYRLRGAPSA